MIEWAGHCSFAFFQYERLPKFCKHCGIIGHPVSRCRSYAEGAKGQDASRLQDNRRLSFEDVIDSDSLHRDDSGVREKEVGQGFEERVSMSKVGESVVGTSNSFGELDDFVGVPDEFVSNNLALEVFHPK